MSLKEYARKRNFKATAEPPARVHHGTGHRFVIQKHAASRLHYDFRLELDGTLKSWAVPKGVPFKKGEKRLAVHVEDHPVSYIDFEGIIPKGQYGGGAVMVWDKGTFEALSKNPSKELKSGKLHFILHGEKLDGEWYLVRLRDGEEWLLIKGGKDMSPVSRKQDDLSAATGRTMKEIAAGRNVWQSNRPPARKTTTRTRKSELPPFVEPMKARLATVPPRGDGEFLYEVKFDGYRAQALKNGGSIGLLSRNKKDLAAKFPELAEAFQAVDAKSFIIDGEVVALDEKGRSSFQLLQGLELGTVRPPLYYYAFDLLMLNGRRLEKRPLEVRKEMLEELVHNVSDILRFSASLGTDAAPLLEQGRKMGLEGLIGKRSGSTYEPGKRSGAWIKLKFHREQEFVIGGFTNPAGSRKYLGALLVGYYKGNKLLFAGKVGTGFMAARLKELYERFKPIVRTDCPFANLPDKRSGRYGQGITAVEMKRCHWVEPKLVCQVRFGEWTRDERLRHPVFIGMREDKRPREVVLEESSEP
jgi:bifunctional non-homologous end joining protein LigD